MFNHAQIELIPKPTDMRCQAESAVSAARSLYLYRHWWLRWKADGSPFGSRATARAMLDVPHSRTSMDFRKPLESLGSICKVCYPTERTT